MLDFFYILTKGGLVLWCVPSTATQFVKIVNDAVDKAVLQVNSFLYLNLKENFISRINQGQGTVQKWVTPLSPHHIHYKLDNEFELVFIVCRIISFFSL
jgi:hypothetical protein